MKLQETLLRVDDGGGESTKERARCTNDMKDQQLVLETRMRPMRDRTTHQYEHKQSSAQAVPSPSRYLQHY